MRHEDALRGALKFARTSAIQDVFIHLADSRQQVPAGELQPVGMPRPIVEKACASSASGILSYADATGLSLQDAAAQLLADVLHFAELFDALHEAWFEACRTARSHPMPPEEALLAWLNAYCDPGLTRMVKSNLDIDHVRACSICRAF